MSEEDSKSSTTSHSPPKPNIPKPNVPKPNVPAPNIPTPSAAPPQSTAPPMASFELEDSSAPKPDTTAGDVEDSSAAPAVPETILHKRVGAAVIDFVIAFGLGYAVSSILPGGLAKLGWILQIGYLLTRDCLPFLDGQSVGKKVLNLRAVTADGQPLTGQWQAGAIRNILFVVPVIGPVVELIILYTREEKPERGQRLGDDFAHTRVIALEAVATTVEESESTDSPTSAE